MKTTEDAEYAGSVIILWRPTHPITKTPFKLCFMPMNFLL